MIVVARPIPTPHPWPARWGGRFRRNDWPTLGSCGILVGRWGFQGECRKTLGGSPMIGMMCGKPRRQRAEARLFSGSGGEEQPEQWDVQMEIPHRGGKATGLQKPGRLTRGTVS